MLSRAYWQVRSWPWRVYNRIVLRWLDWRDPLSEADKTAIRQSLWKSDHGWSDLRTLEARDDE